MRCLLRNAPLFDPTMFNKYKTDWCTRMDSYHQGSKLRTCKLYKFSYCTEQYLLQNIPIRYRSAFA